MISNEKYIMIKGMALRTVKKLTEKDAKLVIRILIRYMVALAVPAM
jgi:hypothetical protein